MFIPLISFSNDEPYKTIKYKEHPSDSLFNYFINHADPRQPKKTSTAKNKISIGINSVFTDLETIQRISDSLMKNNITYKFETHGYYVDFLQTNKCRTQKSLSKSDYYYTSFNSSMFVPGGEAEKGLDLYYVGRTVDDNGKESTVKIVTLTTPAPQPPFPADSIGVFDEKISLTHVDEYINSLNTYDTSNLAVLITKPFKTELEKARAIFMWLNKNIKYDYDGLANNKFTVEVPDVLRKRVAVCDGYSRLFYYLCSGAGITSEYLHGLTPLGLHAWNAVRIDKKWYLIDATWGQRYFLMKPDIFFQDHFPLGINKWTLLPKHKFEKEWKENNLKN